jgi:methylenetetrahydrofolate dehydrogenase (NADP+)/methenyltetrahydrofolate cyclohydrolase
MEDGSIKGDVNRSAYDIPQYLTPVPGGVGPLQMATLLERLVKVTLDLELEPWTLRVPEIDSDLFVVPDAIATPDVMYSPTPELEADIDLEP